MPIIKESLKRLWNADEMRILLLVSLSLQFGLVFLSPLRKRTGQKLLKLLLWFFYLSADYVAILAIGNLLRRQNVGTSCGHGGIGLMAIWGPFLLLHLGGPDTITSYSIEDNELWWRHFLGLVVQVAVTFLVLLELVVIPRLRVAAALVFIAGLVKYSERTWALRSSSIDHLRSSMLKHKPEPPNDLGGSDIRDAYVFFKRTMPLVADLKLISDTLFYFRVHFKNYSELKAFKLVDVELSFLYDVLHTKAILINGLCGFLWRFVSVGMIFSAFVLFLKSEKRGYAKTDIIISYVLFGSALFMELISLLLIIFSDWMIVALEQTKHSLLKNLAVIIAKVMSCFFSESKPRWSKSMGQYSLLSVSLRDTNSIITLILGAVKLKNLWDEFIFIYSVPVPSKLEELLYQEVFYFRDRHGVRTLDFRKVKDCKGEKTLQQEGCSHFERGTENEFEYRILIWHIATDICFHTHDAMNDNHTLSEIREISLIISNYMVYLLIMQPSMMPDGIGEIRFQRTCDEVKEYYDKYRSRLTEEKARTALLNAEIPCGYQWSVLSDALWLAKKLNGLSGEDRRWRVISRVWVEMLCYAASNCKTYYHAKQLSQGGEFLTHVYLLMSHMLRYDQYDLITN